MPIPPEFAPVDRCPAWCERVFCTDSQLPRDRMHRSPIVEVAGVTRTRWLDPHTHEVVRSELPVDMNVLACRYPEDRRTWVVITTDEGALEVSLETAEELHAALGKLLTKLAS